MKNMIQKFRQLPKFIALGLLGVILAVVFIYYPVGMMIFHNIDDRADFTAEAYETPNGSHSIAMAIALMDREVNQHRWVASDPFFFPGSMLVRMPAFQRGIKDGVARFTIELYDQIGRIRGSSEADEDLQKANGLFNYSPYVWLFDFSTSWLPTTSSPKQYQSGIKALQSYNQRLAEGKAIFERRSDNLIDTLERMASDLGSSSAMLASHIQRESGLSFNDSADLFYHTKGRLYAYHMLLRELKRDFPEIIKEKQLESTWNNLLDSLRDGMELGNVVVMNASPNSQFLTNHMAIQGFYVMRARIQLREVTNILLK